MCKNVETISCSFALIQACLPVYLIQVQPLSLFFFLQLSHEFAGVLHSGLTVVSAGGSLPVLADVACACTSARIGARFVFLPWLPIEAAVVAVDLLWVLVPPVVGIPGLAVVVGGADGFLPLPSPIVLLLLLVEGEVLVGLVVHGLVLAELVLDRGGVLDVVLLHVVLVEFGVGWGAGSVLLGELGGFSAFRPALHHDAVDQGGEVAGDAEHDDVVVEVDRPQVKFLPDFADLPVREAEPLLQIRFAIVLAQGVLVALPVVLDPDAFQVAVLEDAVLDEIVAVEAADALESIVEVFPHADYLVFPEDEAVSPALVEALLVAEEPFLAHIGDDRLVPGDLLLFLGGGVGLLHEGNEKLLQSIHTFGEVLRESVVDFPVLD